MLRKLRVRVLSIEAKASQSIHLATLALSIALSASSTQAETVLANLDFNNGFAGGTTQVGPAAVGTAGDTWNGSQSFGGFVGTETPSGNTGGTAPFGAFELLNTAGAASGISYQMTFVNDGGGSSGAFDNFGAVAATGASNLLGDYLFVGGADAGDVLNFTLSGLSANTDYALYLYGNGDMLGQGATWTLDGASQTSAFDGTATLDQGGSSPGLRSTPEPALPKPLTRQHWATASLSTDFN